jgi:hypothetical protein
MRRFKRGARKGRKEIEDSLVVGGVACWGEGFTAVTQGLCLD